MRDRTPRQLAASLLILALFAPPVRSQAGLGHVEDASVVPQGLLRLRAITAWTRYDERFVAGGVAPLGAPFTASSFGATQFAPLGAIQSLVASASATPFTLSLGQARLDATARQEILPLGLEYGLTKRITVGAIMPIVRQRVATLFRIDTAGGASNVGPNLQRTFGAAQQRNATVQTEFAGAVAQLQSRLQSCTTNPAAPGCSTLLARQAEALNLIQSSQSFANDLAQLYGSGSSTGSAFVPTAQSSAQTAIAGRVAAFNTSYQDLLATSTTLIQAVPYPAAGPVGAAEFERYVIEDLGRDSLNTQERLGIGDVEIGAKFALVNQPRSATRPLGMRVTLASSFRLPTGSTDSPSEIADLRIGEGSAVIDSRALVDLQTGRLGLFAGAQFATSVYDKDTTGLASRNSRWTELDVAPRWHLSEAFALHFAYSLRTTDKLGSDQLVGGGVSFSNLAGYGPTRRTLPMEMRFTHLEAVNGGANRPRFFRDQLELRLYFRLR